MTLITLKVILLTSGLLYAQKNDRWLTESDSLFVTRVSDHIQLYYFKSSLDNETVDKILRARESGYRQISEFLELEVPTSLKLYLFPNEGLKYKMTGHHGYGWGFDDVIAEVYNDSIKVDPFHELVHVLGNKIGRPPALLDEGLAVYLSEQMGSCSFFDLAGYPGKKINETLAVLKSEKELIPLSALFAYHDISEATEVVLAYVESASFVKYLIENHGREKFLGLFSQTKAGDLEANKHKFSRVYQMDLTKIEQMWLNSLSP